MAGIELWMNFDDAVSGPISGAGDPPGEPSPGLTGSE
jgi:hypothetical protein